jgi:hypothetical protein
MLGAGSVESCGDGDGGAAEMVARMSAMQAGKTAKSW